MDSACLGRSARPRRRQLRRSQPRRSDVVRNLMDGVLASYRRLDQFAEPTLAVKYPRDAGFRPAASDNRLNAWYWRCSIKGATSGPLAGKKIAIKDNVCVAGIPMMNGSNVLEGYVPDVDATIVTRILGAGGEIVGNRAHCPYRRRCRPASRGARRGRRPRPAPTGGTAYGSLYQAAHRRQMP